jgi:hypothetical protein
MKKYRPVSLKKVRTYPIKKRKSKISLSAVAKPSVKGDSLKTFLDKLPGILAAGDFRRVVRDIVKAREKDRPVVLGMGAHPVKVGLSPVIMDLMQKNVITAVATNGACIVHDFELSFAGHTSEDVGKELCTGAFGMAAETGKYLNRAIKEGTGKGHGIGRSVGEAIKRSKFRFKEMSIFASAYELDIPATVHVAIGTDIIHMHPDADGAVIGQGSFIDFKLFTSVVSDLEGGVYINLGSAVVMPEVFLKALTIARNLGNRVENITTVNMDFVQHYRPVVNVLRRPTMNKGVCYALTGHHEIMFPLLAAAIIEEME